MCEYFDVCNVKECGTCELGGKILKVKYISDTVSPITILDNGDWIDLRVTEDIMMKKGDFKILPLGVAIELPKGYEALIVPRSSTFKKYHILQTNGIGIIDESYCGNNDEWKFPAYCTENTFIPKNTRICQFRIVKHQPNISIIPVRKLNNKDRKGFGSTGTL